MRCHTVLRSRIIKRENGVGRATRLERADLLKILALKKQQRATRLIQARARQHWRPRDIRPDALMRRADRGEVERHSFFYLRNSVRCWTLSVGRFLRPTAWVV